MGEDPNTAMILSQINVEQGEGKSPATFEKYFDSNSSRLWKEKIIKKIGQFSLAIRNRTGYATVLRREHDPLYGIDIYSVDIIGADQTYVFLLNDFMCEVQIQKEVVKHG